MTKAQLIASLVGVPETAEVLVYCVAASNDFDAMVEQAERDLEANGGQNCAELSEITNVGVCEADGDMPAFVTINHRMEYLPIGRN